VGSSGEAIEWLVTRVLEALAREEPVHPLALTLLLRRYCATNGADLADALGTALARAAEPHALQDESSHPAWLSLLAEASSVSDDARLREVAADLIAGLRRSWSHLLLVEPLMLAIDACLTAAEMVDARELVPSAVDELERVIGGAYRPGEGVAHRIDGQPGTRGCLGDHVRSASALLTAYTWTARLPYAMLAEELMQFAHRRLWDSGEGGFFSGPNGGGAKPFVLNCAAARVLCRLATLHDSEEYRAAAVTAPDADYSLDAGRTLSALEPSYRQHGVEGAIYGVALGEWLARP